MRALRKGGVGLRSRSWRRLQKACKHAIYACMCVYVLPISLLRFAYVCVYGISSPPRMLPRRLHKACEHAAYACMCNCVIVYIMYIFSPPRAHPRRMPQAHTPATYVVFSVVGLCVTVSFGLHHGWKFMVLCDTETVSQVKVMFDLIPYDLIWCGLGTCIAWGPLQIGSESPL